MVSNCQLTGNGLDSYLEWVLEDLYLFHHAASDHVCLLEAHQEMLSQFPSTYAANSISRLHIQVGVSKIVINENKHQLGAKTKPNRLLKSHSS